MSGFAGLPVLTPFQVESSSRVSLRLELLPERNKALLEGCIKVSRPKFALSRVFVKTSIFLDIFEDTRLHA